MNPPESETPPKLSSPALIEMHESPLDSSPGLSATILDSGSATILNQLPGPFSQNQSDESKPEVTAEKGIEHIEHIDKVCCKNYVTVTKNQTPVYFTFLLFIHHARQCM